MSKNVDLLLVSMNFPMHFSQLILRQTGGRRKNFRIWIEFLLWDRKRRVERKQEMTGRPIWQFQNKKLHDIKKERDVGL